MKKKIIALLLALVMVVGIVPAAVFAAADGAITPTADATLVFTADKTEAKPGDVINYTLSANWKNPTQGFLIKLDMPAGLSYVAKSGKLTDEFSDIGWALKGFTESTLTINGVIAPAAEATEGFIDVATFQVTVDEDAAAGNYEIGYYPADFSGVGALEFLDEDGALLTDVEVLNATPVKVELEPLAHFVFTPSKTKVVPGDVIDYTLTCSWAKPTQGFLIKLDLPAELEYVAKSGKLSDEFSDIGWALKGFTESTLTINGVIAPPAEATEGFIEVATFQVKVSDDATAGSYEIGYYPADFSGVGALEFLDEDGALIAADRIKIENVATSVVVYVTGIELDMTELELTKEAPEAALTATVKPSAATDKTVTWTSSDETVATVDANGNVTRVGEGTAIITATSNEDETIKATCTVTVPHQCEAATLTKVDAKAADCYTAGNVDYYTCSCGKLYEDADAATETSADAVVVPALDHPAADVSKVDAVAPTHTTAGNIDYWICELCGSMFSDEACDTKVTDVSVPAEGHDDPADRPWLISADTHKKVCSCDDTVILVSEEHTFEWIEDTAATCTSTGVKHEECTVCGYKRNENTEIPMIAHETVKTDAKDSECLEAGNIDYWTCSECGKIFADAACAEEITEEDTVVSATGHDYDSVVTAPTCTDKGYTTYTCKDGDDTYVDNYVDALGHDYVAVVTAPKCEEDGYTTYTCDRCKDAYVSDVVAAIGHDFPDAEAEIEGEWVESETPGIFYGYCKNGCGQYITDVRIVYITGVELVNQDHVRTFYVRNKPAYTLTETIYPNTANEDYTVTWTSSNEEVATVDEDGNVTTHKRGEAVITVTVETESGKTYTDTSTVKVRYNFWQWLIWIFLIGCAWYFV